MLRKVFRIIAVGAHFDHEDRFDDLGLVYNADYFHCPLAFRAGERINFAKSTKTTQGLHGLAKESSHLVLISLLIITLGALPTGLSFGRT